VASLEPEAWRTQRFRLLYESSYVDLQAYCRRRVAPFAVDDVVADAFLVAWQRLDDVTGDPRPWLFGVAHNLIRNRRRKDARSVILHDVLVSEIMTRQGVDDPLGVDEVQALVEALHAMKEADAELLRLAAWEGLPHADIAVVLGCSENAVAIRLHRARGRLRDRLAKDRRWGAATRSPDTTKGPVAPTQVDVDGGIHDERGTH
jgi:RNA polymerase sigma-70 factor (ECF subfamily)